jgi:DNA repair photolyase
VVNPYTGCSFACGYCYASFMGRFVNEPIEEWGDYVYVKVNAVEVFKEDLHRLRDSERHSSILLSSVTDAWQGPEKKYQLARGVLQELSDSTYPGLVSVLTKSPLVLRDSDVLASLTTAEVGVTVTSTDDAISRFMEAHAPSATERLGILRSLNDAGIATYAFLGPLLPHFRYRPDMLDELFRALHETGTRDIFAEHLNTSEYILRRISPLVMQADEAVQTAYESARTAEHRKVLTELVLGLVDKYGFNLRLGTVLDHNRVRREVAGQRAEATT